MYEMDIVFEHVIVFIILFGPSRSSSYLSGPET